MKNTGTSYVKSGQNEGVWIFNDPLSERIRVDDYHGKITEVIKLIESHFYDWVGKVIIKSRPQHLESFLNAGFSEEALVQGYFSGTDMHFMARYLKPQRKISLLPVPSFFEGNKEKFRLKSSNDILITRANKEDAEALAAFYASIFKIYPSPVTDPAYLRKVISGNSVYMILKINGNIISAACAEVNPQYQHAELSDCATIPEYFGQGYIKQVLKSLMSEMDNLGIPALYSIARTASPAMNKVFRDLGFRFTGKMINNVRIVTGLEDMNVWSFYRYDSYSNSSIL